MLLQKNRSEWIDRTCLIKAGQSQGGHFVKLCSKHISLLQRTPHAVGVWRRLLWSGVTSVQVPNIFAVTVIRSWPFHDRDIMVNGHYLPIPPTTSKGSDGERVFVGNHHQNIAIIKSSQFVFNMGL